MAGWVCQDGIFSRIVGTTSREGVITALVRKRADRYEIAVSQEIGPGLYVWWDYCEAKGGAVEQEYKAKRRATALARKLIKGG